MVKKERQFRIQMTVGETNTQVIFDLLKGVASDFKMFELTEPAPVPVPGGVSQIGTNGTQPGEKPKRTHKAYDTTWRNQWASRHWPPIRAIMASSPGQKVDYDDPRILKVLADNGAAITSISPLWTTFLRMGHVERIMRGVYQLVPGK